MPPNSLKRPRDPAGGHWELVCSEISRPFVIKTFWLEVPNGWIYCNTITRARAFTRDEFSQSMVFLYPIEQGPTDRHSYNLKTAKALGLTIPESFLLRADEMIDLGEAINGGE